MKILVFSSLYPNNIRPNHGVFIKERMTHVSEIPGCEIKVVAPAPYYPNINFGSRSWYAKVVKHEMRDGLDVFHPRYFMTPKVGMSTYAWTMFRSVLPTIKRIQQQFDFDLIDAHYMYPDSLAAVYLARHFKKPVVVSARGSDINLFSKFPRIKRLMVRALDGADHAVAVSAALKRAMVDMGASGDRISVIPNGVDQQKFFLQDKSSARARLQLPRGKIVFAAGALRPLKGFDILIRAFHNALYASKDKALYLIIAGEGGERQKLQQLIRDLALGEHVRLVGAVAHSELNSYFNASDVFCLASSREGWPNVLMEALSCGVPVVATNVGGIPEIVSSDALGILCDRSPEAFAEALNSALNKNWNSELIADHMKQFTWERTAEKVMAVFEAALSKADQC